MLVECECDNGIVLAVYTKAEHRDIVRLDFVSKKFDCSPRTDETEVGSRDNGPQLLLGFW